MPKAKQKASRPRDDSDDDKPAATQASQSQGNTQSTQAIKTAANMGSDEQERRLADLVQYLLIMDQKKLPIKKIDINKQVLKEFSKAFPIMIQKATERLSSVFGLMLIELQEKQKGSYILVNKIEMDTDEPHLEWPEEDNAKMGILMVILSLIFMGGNIIQDSKLWHTLKKLGVDPEVHHEVFGDVKRLVTTEFVRQGYLEYTKQPNTDPPVYDFKWGQRSMAETSKRNVLDFVCQIFDMEAEKWTSQWQDVLRSEGQTNGQVQNPTPARR